MTRAILHNAINAIIFNVCEAKGSRAVLDVGLDGA